MNNNKIIRWNGASVEVLDEVSIPCPPNGSKEIFREGKAFLCLFKNLPFKNKNGVFSKITGYIVIGEDPWRKLAEWEEFPPEWIDEEWDETDLFSQTPQEAIETKIRDLENIWDWSSLNTICQHCEEKEQCKKQLKSLNKTSFSFFPSFFEPIMNL